MRHSAMRRTALAVLGLVVGIIPATNLSAPASAEPGEPGDFEVPADEATRIADSKVEKTFIVTMFNEPAATYDGGTAGIPATAPARGEKLDAESEAVVDYRQFLAGRHDAALRGAGIDPARKLYDYSVAVNGFAARIDGRQAAALRQQRGVVSVEPDRKYHLDTITTPDFLGLTKPGGAWDKGRKGENVIIGTVDSGIWPANRSFSERKNGVVVYTEPTDPELEWSGTCQSGERFSSANCNNKLIGARYYNAGWGGNAGIDALFPYEYNSPRDADGHGSHTASTSGGNRAVDVVIDGQNYGKASGMAPRARVAAYKVCWGRGGEGGCFGSDSVAAIDQAVADGVDVINFSISGTSTNFLDPVELAFLRASNAGVFVAASAGNSGPDASTVAHPSPWITTVAASTHDRLSEADLTLGNGATYTGSSSQSTGTPELPMIYAGDAARDGVDPADAALCFRASLDPALVDGKMVLCDRGVSARTEKSLVVRNHGGEAMVLGNTSPNSLNADIHFVPTVHVDDVDRTAILAYVQGGGTPTGEMSPSVTIDDTTAPQTAAFSSRGPLQATGDLLKPDITAPGVDVLAAVSPDGYFGRNYDLISGTSMSSPHIAGLAADLKSGRRRWLPSELKSALMTTASTVDDATPFDVGSGHVNLNRALGPNIVYPTGFQEYLAFLCGQGLVNPASCSYSIDASDLNQPNIAIEALAGAQTVQRRVKSVIDKPVTFTADVDAPPGIDVTVTPSTMTVGRNEPSRFQVTFETTDEAVLDEYAFGTLTWRRPDGRGVQSELVVKPVALAFPAEVFGEGPEGADEFDIEFGYTGVYTAEAHGLNPAKKSANTVQDDPGNDINGALDCYFSTPTPSPSCGLVRHKRNVPAGTAFARFSLFDEFTDGNDDLDLYVFDGGGNFVGGSGSGTSAEEVNVPNPAPGTYSVFVHGWQTDGPSADYTLFNWFISGDPAADDGSLVIDSAPPAAVAGETGTIEYSWSGLDPDNKYLGAVSHNRGAEVLGLTLVNVDNYGPSA